MVNKAYSAREYYTSEDLSYINKALVYASKLIKSKNLTTEQFTQVQGIESLLISLMLRSDNKKLCDKVRKSYYCKDCKKDSGGYMVKTEVWLKAWPDYFKYLKSRKQGLRHGLLCLQCLERRLGRKVIYDDFREELPINEAILYIMRRFKKIRTRQS
jgi:hypothetical protein